MNENFSRSSPQFSSAKTAALRCGLALLSLRRLPSCQPDADTRLGLAIQYPPVVWLAVVCGLSIVHYLLFGLVHNLVDMRVCLGHLPDPLLELVPFDERWTFVTRDLYVASIVTVTGVLFFQAYCGLHTPILRWGLALTFMSSMRMVTMLLIPLCRLTVEPGGPPPLTSPSMLDLGLVSIPWRMFALNDLVYSGHASLFLLLLRATRTWASIARLSIGGFLAVLIYGLLATRDHYSVDIMLALPFSYLADTLAVSLLRIANPVRDRGVLSAVPFIETDDSGTPRA